MKYDESKHRRNTIGQFADKDKTVSADADGEPLAGRDHENENLAYHNIADEDLRQLTFAGVNLSSSTIERTNLENARFDDVDLSDARLANKTRLDGMALNGGDATGIGIDNCMVDEAVLNEATLDDANIANSTCEYLTMCETSASGITFDNCAMNNMSVCGQTSVDDAHFTNCTMGSAQFANMYMRNSEIEGCDLTCAKFTDADARNCTFHASAMDMMTADDKSDFSGSRFADCSMHNSQFNDTYMSDVSFTDCNLSGAHFTDSPLERVKFRGANLEKASFGDASLRGSRFDYCDLMNTRYTPASVELNDNTVTFHGTQFGDPEGLCATYTRDETGRRAALLKDTRSDDHDPIVVRADPGKTYGQTLRSRDDIRQAMDDWRGEDGNPLTDRQKEQSVIMLDRYADYEHGVWANTDIPLDPGTLDARRLGERLRGL